MSQEAPPVRKNARGSITLSKGTKLEQIPLNLTGKITTYLVCDLSWPRRAILGNAAAIIILMIEISNSGETLIKKQITLIIIALIGLMSITPPKSPTIGEACKEARNSVPC